MVAFSGLDRYKRSTYMYVHSCWKFFEMFLYLTLLPLQCLALTTLVSLIF